METTFIYMLLEPDNITVRYIGKSNTPDYRFERHLKEKSNPYKVEWVAKLKSENKKPSIEVLDEVPKTEWDFWERHYISLFRSWGFDLLNMRGGGSGNDHTEESKIKISKAHTGRKHTDQSKKNMSAAHIGQVAWNKGLHGDPRMAHTQEWRDYMSVVLTGQKRAEETKRKISSGNMGKIQTPESRAKIRLGILNSTNIRKGKKRKEEDKKKSREKNSKIVYQFTKDGVLVSQYNSITDVGIETGFNIGAVSVCCCAKTRKSAHGFFWSYDINFKPIPRKKQKTSWCKGLAGDLRLKHSEESKRKRGLIRRKKYGRTVYRFDLGGNLIDSFPSIADAVEMTGLKRHGIKNCCAKRQLKAYGYRWSFDIKWNQ